MKVLALILFAAFAVLGVYIQARIPFYGSWDMDFITVNDLYRMTEDFIPLHINHTAFGMYLPMRIFWQWFPLEAATLTEWMASPIPMFPLADAIIWLRYTCIFAGAVTIIATWSALPSLGLCLFLVSLPCLWLYPLQTIRTELWAVMWYALAFAVIPHIRQTKTLLLCFALAGMGFVTKYQGVFIHVGILLLVLNQLAPEAWPRLPNRRTTYIVLGIFLTLSVSCMVSYIPRSFAVFSRATAPNLFFIAALIVLCLPLLRTPWVRATGPVWWAGLGIIIVFPLHFFLGLSFETSFEYLLFDWRMIFLRHVDPAIATARTENIFLWSLKHHALILILWFAMAIRAWTQSSDWKRYLIMVYGILIVASLRLAVRGDLQDALWNDFLILFGFLLFPLHAPRRWTWALGIFAVMQMYQLRDLPFRTRYVGQYDLERFWREPYESLEVRYTERMAPLLPRKEEINALAQRYPFKKE